MAKFGDEIDWGVEARRAASESPPGEAPGEILTNFREALGATASVLRVVDCGCNIGRFYSQFAAAGFHYVGIDQSTEALDIARHRWPIAQFVESLLWEDWPSRLALFDAALCNAVLQHNLLAEKELILPRIAQAVKKGGLFGMQESTVLTATRTQLTHDQWVALVERHGFRLVKTWHRNEFGKNDAYLFRRL